MIIACVGDGLRRDARRVLSVALLVEAHPLVRSGSGSVRWRRVQRVEATDVRAELLDSAGAERVAAGDQHANFILDQPEADLQTCHRMEKITCYSSSRNDLSSSSSPVFT